MDRAFDQDRSDLAADFERLAVEDDGAAAMAMLASGLPIHIVRPDTPSGHVVRIHPGGREEVVRVDREAAAKVLGR